MGGGGRVRTPRYAVAGSDSEPKTLRGPSSRRDGVREPTPEELKVILASATFQKSRLSNLASVNGNLGNSDAAEIFDTHARLVEIVEEEVRHGINGTVSLPGKP